MLTIFNKAVTTNSGRALLAESVATETPLQFTSMVTGSGSYTEEEKTVAALEVMTALKVQKQSFPISHLSRTTPYEAVVKSVINNYELTVPYTWNEVGLYAKLEGSAASPILYSIAVVAGSEGTVIPAYSQTTVLDVIQSFYLMVNNSANVSILVNDSFEMLDDAGFNDDLTTTEKGTLVGAINELDGDIGDLSTLATTAKISMVAAVNELKSRDDEQDTAIAKCECLVITQNNISALPVTISNAAIETDMVVINSVLSNPAAQTGDWTVNTNTAGQATISGTINGTTNLTLYLMKSR